MLCSVSYPESNFGVLLCGVIYPVVILSVLRLLCGVGYPVGIWVSCCYVVLFTLRAMRGLSGLSLTVMVSRYSATLSLSSGLFT